MFTDAGSLGTDVDGNQIEFPKTSQIAASGYGYIKGCANLDAVCAARAGYLIGQPGYLGQLTGQIVEQSVRITTFAAV